MDGVFFILLVVAHRSVGSYVSRQTFNFSMFSKIKQLIHNNTKDTWKIVIFSMCKHIARARGQHKPHRYDGIYKTVDTTQMKEKKIIFFSNEEKKNKRFKANIVFEGSCEIVLYFFFIFVSLFGFGFVTNPTKNRCLSNCLYCDFKTIVHFVLIFQYLSFSLRRLNCCCCQCFCSL